MEPVVFGGLKLLTYIRKIHLSLEDTSALLRRLETDRCRPEDYEVLIRIVRAHTELSADFLDTSPVETPSSPGHPGQRQGQGAKRTRRRHCR